MATELGKAYVQIVPSAKGIRSALEETLGGPLQDTSRKLGPSIGQRIGAGFKSIGGAMTSYITKPALAAVGALGGATLFAGWKRMTEIDNAKVKLQAIGNSAKDVEKITTNALNAVKGTAYGMNDAMTASASAVAAGIKPGKELEHYLKAIADASAVAGVDMNEMGYIFNSVATKGKASNKELKELAGRGIPIYQYLGDQMGKTAEEVFDLAKKGDISLADFQKAVETHIGGAAQEIGSKTITGAIANLQASISRIGANFLGSADDADSFAGKLLPLLNNLMANLEPIEAKAKEFGSAFADGFQKLIDILGKIPMPTLAGIAGALVGIGPAIGIITKLSAAMGALGITISGPVVAVGALVGALAIAFARSENFRKALGNLVKEVGPMLLPILKDLGSLLKQVAKQVISAGTAIGEALTPVIEVLTPILKVMIMLIGVKLKMAFKLVGAVVESGANAVKLFAAVIQGVFTSIKVTVSQLAAPFRKFVDTVKTVFGKAWDIIKGVADKIKGVFNFKISMPHVPLPHFSISPAGWKMGDLVKGKIPSLSVNWYAKGGIVDGATLIGAGEKGKEAIVPLDPFWERLDKIKGNNITNNITVYSNDGRQFARDLIDAMEQEARAY